MFSSGLSGLKSLGDKLAEGAREFENSLAQPLISPSSPQQRRPDSPSSASADSPVRSNPKPFLSSGFGSPTSAVNVQLQSASQLADSALSSLRLSFRKGRESLDGVRSRSVSVEPPSPRESPASSPIKDKVVAATVHQEPLSLLKEEELPSAVQPESQEATPTDGKEDKHKHVSIDPVPVIIRLPTPPPTAAAPPDEEEADAWFTSPTIDTSERMEETGEAEAEAPTTSSALVSLPSATISSPPTSPLREPALSHPLSPLDPQLSLRPASPDDRFRISITADATPEGPSRTSTPALETSSPFEEPLIETTPLPTTDLPADADAELLAPISEKSSSLPYPTLAEGGRSPSSSVDDLQHWGIDESVEVSSPSPQASPTPAAVAIFGNQVKDEPVDELQEEVKVEPPIETEEEIKEPVKEEPEVVIKEEPTDEVVVNVEKEDEVKNEVKEQVTEATLEEAPMEPPPADEAVSEQTPRPSPISAPAPVEIAGHPDWLQQKVSLEKVVADLLPSLSGLDDIEAFEGELQNLIGKNKVFTSEVAGLSAQLSQHKERMEEVRDTHRLEVQSQSSQLETLTLQLSQKEQQLSQLQSQLSTSSDVVKSLQSTITKSSEDYDKLKIVAKEEEEKRTKALSLLRALRQKLVKAEKDKEEIEKEKDTLKLSENSAQDALRGDRARFDQEIMSMRAAQEGQLSKLRGQFEREIASIKAQYEREAMAKKGQFELDAITTKASHGKELQVRDARITQLEGTVRELTAGRDDLFGQLQVRTAEVESAKSEQESLKGQTSELRYELNEAKDKVAALVEELEDLKRVQRDNERDDGNIRTLVAEADARHDAKIKEMETRQAQLEKDRLETEEEMGRNLQERLKEVERMREQIVKKDIDYAASVHEQQQRDEKIGKSETKNKELEFKVKSLESIVEELRTEVGRSVKAEAAVREELSDRAQRGNELEQRLETVQMKESALRSNNKILRDELRKLQSGVLLSEKQRNPGVGYFANYRNPLASTSTISVSSPGSDGSRTPRSRSESMIGGEPPNFGSPSATSTSAAEGAAASLNATSGDAAVNFEYMRNVILQFLERPEMRPHLLSVLGVILHFTPAEARRLHAKAL